MDGRDLASAACTCRAWREAVGALQREGVWRDALFREFTPYPEYRTTRTEVQTEFSCFDEPAHRPVWREQYRRMFTAHRNWQRGRATHETHALPWTSGEGVLSCKLADSLLVLGTTDGRVVLFDLAPEGEGKKKHSRERKALGLPPNALTQLCSFDLGPPEEGFLHQAREVDLVRTEAGDLRILVTLPSGNLGTNAPQVKMLRYSRVRAGKETEHRVELEWDFAISPGEMWEDRDGGGSLVGLELADASFMDEKHILMRFEGEYMAPGGEDEDDPGFPGLEAGIKVITTYMIVDSVTREQVWHCRGGESTGLPNSAAPPPVPGNYLGPATNDDADLVSGLVVAVHGNVMTIRKFLCEGEKQVLLPDLPGKAGAGGHGRPRAPLLPAGAHAGAPDWGPFGGPPEGVDLAGVPPAAAHEFNPATYGEWPGAWNVSSQDSQILVYDVKSGKAIYYDPEGNVLREEVMEGWGRGEFLCQFWTGEKLRPQKVLSTVSGPLPDASGFMENSVVLRELSGKVLFQSHPEQMLFGDAITHTCFQSCVHRKIHNKLVFVPEETSKWDPESRVWLRKATSRFGYVDLCTGEEVVIRGPGEEDPFKGLDIMHDSVTYFCNWRYLVVAADIHARSDIQNTPRLIVFDFCPRA